MSFRQVEFPRVPQIFSRIQAPRTYLKNVNYYFQTSSQRFYRWLAELRALLQSTLFESTEAYFQRTLVTCFSIDSPLIIIDEGLDRSPVSNLMIGSFKSTLISTVQQFQAFVLVSDPDKISTFDSVDTLFRFYFDQLTACQLCCFSIFCFSDHRKSFLEEISSLKSFSTNLT